MLTSHRIALAVRQSRSLRRWHIIRDASDEGKTKEEAAHLAGMTVGGLSNLIFKHVGSTCWPLRSKE